MRDERQETGIKHGWCSIDARDDPPICFEWRRFTTLKSIGDQSYVVFSTNEREEYLSPIKA